jgi:hypothetical protein
VHRDRPTKSTLMHAGTHRPSAVHTGHIVPIHAACTGSRCAYCFGTTCANALAHGTERAKRNRVGTQCATGTQGASGQHAPLPMGHIVPMGSSTCDRVRQAPNHVGQHVPKTQVSKCAKHRTVGTKCANHDAHGTHCATSCAGHCAPINAVRAHPCGSQCANATKPKPRAVSISSALRCRRVQRRPRKA